MNSMYFFLPKCFRAFKMCWDETSDTRGSMKTYKPRKTYPFYRTRRPLGVGHALKEVLCQASATGRLVAGTIDCASVLKQ